MRIISCAIETQYYSKVTINSSVIEKWQRVRRMHSINNSLFACVSTDTVITG